MAIGLLWQQMLSLLPFSIYQWQFISTWDLDGNPGGICGA
jgi:hypothetical protein